VHRPSEDPVGWLAPFADSVCATFRGGIQQRGDAGSHTANSFLLRRCIPCFSNPGGRTGDHPTTSASEGFKLSCAFSLLAAGAGWQDMTSRDTRREENQKLFRKGNERLHDLVENQVNDSTPVPFLCECAAEDCQGRVEVQLAEWEAVAARPNHYLMVSGHPRSESEQAVGSVGEYDVVQKPD
jgi:hypothetical protein